MILNKEILELEDRISDADQVNLSISEKGVDWHIDHSLRVINAVCHALKKSVPEDYKWSFNYIRSYIFLIGYIPRGKGRAPKSVVAQGEIHLNDLREQMDKAKVLLKELEDLPANSHFPHPYFGLLNRNMTIKFLRIHTRHHLKIIKDIIGNK